MKKNRKSTILTLSFLIVVGMLFGYAPQSYAQGDQDWTKPVNLSRSGIATNPISVIDSNNEIHTIWIDNADSYKYSHSADGKTWSKPITIKYPFDLKGPLPVLFSDDGESIHVFWIGSNKSLSYVRATPSNIADPAKWQSATTRLATDVLTYDVFQDSQGSLHVAYIHKVSTEIAPAGIYYRQLLTVGGGWSNEKMLYESEYFRSTTQSGSFIRVATSNESPAQKVYVTWDSRPQKSVFVAVSNDSGLTWDEARQIKGAEDTGGIDTPFNLNVAAADDKVLFMWQVGELGTAKCEVFSQWSEDNGKSWGEIVSVFNGRTDCPVSSKLIAQKDGYIVAILNGQVDSTLVAWNGKKWSNPQTNAQLPALSNPLTLNAIHLSCRFDLINRNRLYVVGCDQGGGGDVWFLSRTLESVKNWFSVPKTWSAPVTISVKSETISSLSSVSDSEGVIHSIWSQSSLLGDGTKKIAINYAQWDGKQWTRPGPVMSGLKGVPLQMSFAIDTRERLLLSWVDGGSGDLLFSWANADRANLGSEWETPVILPSPSNLIVSSDIIVDGSDRLIVVYAIPVNEDRGIYIVQSTDTGKTWSSPVRVFDAVSASWERIGNPKISLTEDGVLHLIFSRNSVRTGQPVGLHYSRSVDGGVTWSDTEILSERDILWSDIVSYDNHTVHVVWQENDGLVYANLSQVSEDSGVSWGKLLSVTSVNDSSTPVALAAGGPGNLHLIQLLKNGNITTVNQENLILQDWKWTGSRWEIASSSDFVIEGQGIGYSVTADITTTGLLGVSMSAQYSDSDNRIQNEILAFSRLPEESSISKEPIVALIPTPVNLSDETEVPDILPTQPVDLSELDSNNAITSQLLRNIVGIIIILALVVIAILLIRSRNKDYQK
jgi:hypothetical protein